MIRRPGCLLCREEASELSTIKGDLDKIGVKLIGIAHEIQGVAEFKSYFKGISKSMGFHNF